MKYPYFAERLRVALAKKNMSGAALARELGVSRAAVAPWMQADHEPPADRLVAIAKALEVDVSWLISPYPVDLHGPATDAMRDALIGLFVAGVLSEGQTSRATGLGRIELRKRALERVDELYGDIVGTAHSLLTAKPADGAT